MRKWTKVDIRIASSWPGHVKIHVAYLKKDKKKTKVRNVCQTKWKNYQNIKKVTEKGPISNSISLSHIEKVFCYKLNVSIIILVRRINEMYVNNKSLYSLSLGSVYFVTRLIQTCYRVSVHTQFCSEQNSKTIEFVSVLMD